MLWASYLKRMKSYLFAIILLQKKVRFLGLEEQFVGVRLDPRQIKCAAAVLMAVARVV